MNDEGAAALAVLRQTRTAHARQSLKAAAQGKRVALGGSWGCQECLHVRVQLL